MRITAGRWGSIPLFGVPGEKTRPTADKVKEAIFHMIGPYFNGGWVLDAFAGSGALALEALSRGAARAVLIEKSVKARQTIIRNVERLGAEDDVLLMAGNVENLPDWLWKKRESGALLKPYPLFAEDGGEGFQFAFFDPPYRYSAERLLKLIHHLKEQGSMTTKSLLVLERPGGRNEVHFWEEHLVLNKIKTYGGTEVIIGMLKPE
ncbi:MAG: 16S rRNA (guanine(966)-N(2))-methyltransferase RsmD [Candidatus Carbobacillus altaicus]|nr:16S rRNA (guanine(966)-N(2))-methyltransferase RsmD [Candidatus Carbobacillus altaicus]